ncbi:MAG: hypothetical protein RSB25_18030, partial [Acinetobacter sp.]
MAVPEQTPYIEHTGNGVTASFSLGFQCESKDHLIVLVDEIEPPIATWSLTGGNVVFTTAPAVGKKIKLQRNTPFSRTTDYQSYNNSFRPPAVNKDFDWIWLKLQELGVADWILGARIDALKNYVDRKDDELKAYLMEEIRKQGVALDQLDEYYNYLMQRLAQIAVDKGWSTSFVVDASGKTQQEINDYQRNLTQYSVEKWAEPLNIPIGDGVYRNVKELYTVGSGYKRFNSRVELETWLGFNLGTLINVVEEAPIDTVIIQKAINELSALYLTMNVAQTLKFKTGGIYYSTGLNHKCGVDIVSDGVFEFKKRPALDITNEYPLTWFRIMVSDPLSFNTAEKCKHRCLIKGV